MTDLPAGWEWATLTEIATWGSGGTPRSGDPLYYNGSIPWAVIGDLNNAIISATASSITDEGLANSSAKLVPRGTILIAMYGSIGKLGIAGVRMAMNQAIAFAIPNPEAVDDKYLFWYLQSQQPKLLKAGKGATQQNISQTLLKSWSAPLPPLAEQRRIVAALEDHLPHLRKVETTLGATTVRARQLITNLLDLAVSPPETVSPTVLLGDVATHIRNGLFVSRAQAVPDGVPILRIGAVRPLRLDTNDLRYSRRDEQEVAESGFLLRSGDLLFTRYNGNPDYVGACAVVPDEISPLTYPDKLIRVSVDRSRAMPEFVAMACSSSTVRAIIRGYVKTTAGQVGISGKDLRMIPLPLPSLEDQHRRVAEFSEQRQRLAQLTDKLEVICDKATRLRNSLLADAFSGRLVPQDPADEPASELLARIRERGGAAGRATTARAGRVRGPKRAVQKETLL